VEQITISVVTCAETGALVASWDDPQGSGGLTTQAETLSELESNIREAISVHFEPDEIPKRIRLHFVDDPVLAAA
jgi:predicted RNase H-like HicB family nuclease